VSDISKIMDLKILKICYLLTSRMTKTNNIRESKDKIHIKVKTFL